MGVIDKIRADIERRIEELDEQIVDIYDSKAVLRKDELQRLLSFLDTLQEPDIEDVKIEWWNKGYIEGYKSAHIPARELGLPIYKLGKNAK